MGHPAVYRSALLAPLVVDLLLTPINQGDVILTHGFTTRVLFKIVLTYLVCFTVATFAALWAARIREPGQRGGGDGAPLPGPPRETGETSGVSRTAGRGEEEQS